MAGLFKRIMGGSEEAVSNPWPEARAWAEREGHRFALGRGLEGFVVEVAGTGGQMRIEWGPSQRHYVYGQELRIRAEVGAGRGLQMMAANCELLRRLEREVFEQFTEGTETRIDDQTPEEMRWVVMYPQVPAKALGNLNHRFGLLGDRPRAAQMWLEQGLSSALEAAARWHAPGTPLALIAQRGRFVLRTSLPEPNLQIMDGALALATVATAAARRVAQEVDNGSLSSHGPSTWGTTAAPQGTPTLGDPA